MTEAQPNEAKINMETKNINSKDFVWTVWFWHILSHLNFHVKPIGSCDVLL